MLTQTAVTEYQKKIGEEYHEFEHQKSLCSSQEKGIVESCDFVNRNKLLKS